MININSLRVLFIEGSVVKLIYKIFVGLFFTLPIFGMELSDKSFDKHFMLQRQRISEALRKAID